MREEELKKMNEKGQKSGAEEWQEKGRKGRKKSA